MASLATSSVETLRPENQFAASSFADVPFAAAARAGSPSIRLCNIHGKHRRQYQHGAASSSAKPAARSFYSNAPSNRPASEPASGMSIE